MLIKYAFMSTFVAYISTFLYEYSKKDKTNKGS